MMMPSSRTWSWLLVWAVLAAPAAAQDEPAATQAGSRDHAPRPISRNPRSPSGPRHAGRRRLASHASRGHRRTPNTQLIADLHGDGCSSSCWPRSSAIGVIRRVSRLLHTPLMSLTNAISAISVVGAIIVAGGAALSDRPFASWAPSPCLLR